MGSVARWSRRNRLAVTAAAYAAGLELAARTGDLQTKKEIEVFLRRPEKRDG